MGDTMICKSISLIALILVGSSFVVSCHKPSKEKPLKYAGDGHSFAEVKVKIEGDTMEILELASSEDRITAVDMSTDRKIYKELRDYCHFIVDKGVYKLSYSGSTLKITPVEGSQTGGLLYSLSVKSSEGQTFGVTALDLPSSTIPGGRISRGNTTIDWKASEEQEDFQKAPSPNEIFNPGTKSIFLFVFCKIESPAS